MKRKNMKIVYKKKPFNFYLTKPCSYLRNYLVEHPKGTILSNDLVTDK